MLGEYNVTGLPMEYIDDRLTGRRYTADDLTLAPFMAGSLREIVLSPEFSKIPLQTRSKIKHLCFLMHITCRCDDLTLIFKLHCGIMQEINAGKTNWIDTHYFTKVEEDTLRCLEKKQAGTQVQLGTYCSIEEDSSEENICVERVMDQDETGDQYENMTTDNQRPESKGGDLVKSEKSPKSSKKKSKQTVKHTCPYCNLSKASGKGILRHIEREHRGEPPSSLLCQTCGESSLGFSAHLLHLETHLGPYTCDKCQKVFSEKGKYKRHSASCNNSADGEMCPYCGKTYKHLQPHLYAVHTEREVETCSLCDYKTILPGGVNRHYKRVHNKPEVCSLCNKTVKDLKRHYRRGTCGSPDTERRTYSCTECDKVFTQNYHLIRHINTVHLKSKDFSCPQCTYKTTNNFNLNIHVKRVHERQELRTQCTFCSKQVYNLSFHLKAYHQEELLSGKV